jgi:hypothetical protein
LTNYLKGISILISVLFFSCNEKIKNESGRDSNAENKTIYVNDNFEIARIEDSVRIVNDNRIRKKISELDRKGIFGQWRTSTKGYKTKIIFVKKGEEFHAEINFLDGKSKPTINKLQKKGDNYYVIGSSANEFYVINKSGNLELRDNQGLFTTGYNTYPDSQKKRCARI